MKHICKKTKTKTKSVVCPLKGRAVKVIERWSCDSSKAFRSTERQPPYGKLNHQSLRVGEGRQKVREDNLICIVQSRVNDRKYTAEHASRKHYEKPINVTYTSETQYSLVA